MRFCFQDDPPHQCFTTVGGANSAWNCACCNTSPIDVAATGMTPSREGYPSSTAEASEFVPSEHHIPPLVGLPSADEDVHAASSRAFVEVNVQAAALLEMEKAARAQPAVQAALESCKRAAAAAARLSLVACAKSTEVTQAQALSTTLAPMKGHMVLQAVLEQESSKNLSLQSSGSSAGLGNVSSVVVMSSCDRADTLQKSGTGLTHPSSLPSIGEHHVPSRFNQDFYADKDVLRAVPVWKALQRFGGHFRSNDSPEETFALSEQVEFVDEFWSHSWSANSTFKIFTLINRYWSPGGATFSVVVAIVVALFMTTGVLPGKFCSATGCKVHEDCSSAHSVAQYCDVHNRCMMEALCCDHSSRAVDGACPNCPPAEQIGVIIEPALLIAAIAFVIFALAYRPRLRAFLDRICIHQTDLEMKRRGIDGLGGFLRNSRSLVVLWDATYFTRLWCVFEISSFIKLHKESSIIIILPLVRGFGVMVGLLMLTVYFLMIPLAEYGDGDEGFVGNIATFIYFVVLGTGGAHLARLYGRKRLLLREQLEGFYCDMSQCWCCSVNHVHPDTGEEIDCDRALVYAAIDAWFPEGGRCEFEKYVREQLYRDIEKKLTGLLRVRDAFILSLPFLWKEIASAGRDCTTPALLFGWHVVKAFLLYFSMCPLLAGLLVFAAALERRNAGCRTCVDWSVSFLIGLLWTPIAATIQLIFNETLYVGLHVSILLAILGLLLGKALLRGCGFSWWHRLNERAEGKESTAPPPKTVGTPAKGAVSPSSKGSAPSRTSNDDSSDEGLGSDSSTRYVVAAL